MGTPHKHAAVIKAWADGAEIQVYYGEWTNVVSPTWRQDLRYRVKPKEPGRYFVRLARHKDGSIMPYGAPNNKSPHLADDRWDTDATPNMRWCSDVLIQLVKQ